MGPWLWLAVPAWAALGSGIVTGWGLLQHLGITLLVLQTASYAMVRLSARGLTVSGTVDRVRMAAGEEVVETYRIENRGRWPAFWVEIAALDLDDAAFESGEFYRTNADTRPGGTTVLRRRGTIPHRGRYHAGSAHVRVRDPLGLFSHEVARLPGASITVFPQPADRLSAAASARQSGDSRHRWGTEGADASYGDLRDYVPGDSLSRIHWRSSARRGTLIVTERETARRQAAWLLVDLSGTFAQADAAAAAAARLLESLARSGRPVGAIVAGAEIMFLPAQRGPGTTTRILDALATIRASARTQLDAITGSASQCTDAGSIHIVSTARPSTTHLRRLRAMCPTVSLVPVPALQTPSGVNFPDATEPWTVRTAATAALALTVGLVLLTAHATIPLLGLAGETRLALVGVVGVLIAAGGAQLLDHARFGTRSNAAGTIPAIAPAGLVVGMTTNLQVPAVPVALCVLLVSLACGWLVSSERQAWPVIMLAGSAMLMRANDTRIYEDRFPWLLVAAIALVACLSIVRSRRWVTGVAAVALGCVCVPASWLLPTSRAWSLSISASVPHVITHFTVVAGRTSASLTDAFHPSDQILMTVRVNKRQAVSYFQSAVLNQYDGQTWTRSGDIPQVLAAGTPLSTWSGGPGAVIAHVTAAQPTQEVIVPATSWAEVTAQSVSIPIVGLFRVGSDLPLELRGNSTIAPGTTYTVQTAGPIGPVDDPPSDADLRVPGEPVAVRTLANRLTESVAMPAQKAQAIASYLRDSGVYTYDIHAVSIPGQDAVADFLLRTHRGYCMQFASAMVILAREANLPARFITGYLASSAGGGQFTVRQKDAHAWAQVYVVPYGWVAFEATAGFRLSVPGVTTLPGHTGIGPRHSVQHRVVQGPNHGFRRRPTGTSPVSHQHRPSRAGLGDASIPIGIAATLFGLMLLAGWTLRPRTLAQQYRWVVRWGPSGPIEPSTTPLEYAERYRDGDSFDRVHLIASLYSLQRYVGKRPDDADLRRAREAWWSLRREWLLRHLRRR